MRNQQRVAAAAATKDVGEQIADHRRAGGAAYISLDETAAIEAARASGAARQAGYVPSLLAGLPVSIKAFFDVKGGGTAPCSGKTPPRMTRACWRVSKRAVM